MVELVLCWSILSDLSSLHRLNIRTAISHYNKEKGFFFLMISRNLFKCFLNKNIFLQDLKSWFTQKPRHLKSWLVRKSTHPKSFIQKSKHIKSWFMRKFRDLHHCIFHFNNRIFHFRNRISNLRNPKSWIVKKSWQPKFWSVEI